MRGERSGLSEVKKVIMAREDAPIANEINNEEIDLFILRKKWEGKWPSREATIIHNLLTNFYGNTKYIRNLIYYIQIMI